MPYEVTIIIPNVYALSETEAVIKARNMAQIWNSGFVEIREVEEE